MNYTDAAKLNVNSEEFCFTTFIHKTAFIHCNENGASEGVREGQINSYNSHACAEKKIER